MPFPPLEISWYNRLEQETKHLPIHVFPALERSYYMTHAHYVQTIITRPLRKLENLDATQENSTQTFMSMQTYYLFLEKGKATPASASK